MRKLFSLALIIVLIGSTLIMVKPACAQTIPAPSIPTFSVHITKNVPFYIAPVTSTDPYSGNNVTTNYGRIEVYNELVVFTIKNQPFTPYNDSSGKYVGLYYNFRYKGHFEDKWTCDPFNPDGLFSRYIWRDGWRFFQYYTPSSSDYTTITFDLHSFVGYPAGNDGPALPNGGQLDFQVQAQIGNISRIPGGSLSLGTYYNFTGESSDWTNTQTITIPAASTSPSSTVPEFPALAIVPLLLVIMSFVIIVKKKLP